jgi:hypothetical protein
MPAVGDELLARKGGGANAEASRCICCGSVAWLPWLGVLRRQGDGLEVRGQKSELRG